MRVAGDFVCGMGGFVLFCFAISVLFGCRGGVAID